MRTKGQNEILVSKVLEALSSGKTIKEVSWDFKIPLHTLTNLFSRYRKRYGFKTTFQMVAVYNIVKEKKHARKRNKRNPGLGRRI